MNKKTIIFFLFLALVSYNCFAAKGVVVKVKDDKAVISYNMGYLLVEWYGGHSPYKGDVYIGEFNTYGFKELFCASSDSESRFYIEDYMADKEQALEFLYGR